MDELSGRNKGEIIQLTLHGIYDESTIARFEGIVQLLRSEPVFINPSMAMEGWRFMSQLLLAERNAEAADNAVQRQVEWREALQSAASEIESVSDICHSPTSSRRQRIDALQHIVDLMDSLGYGHDYS